MSAQPNPQRRSYAAVYIDFENIYYFIKNHYLENEDTHNYAVDLIRRLRTKLKDELGLETLVLEAYADFESMPSGPQGPMYLLGVKTNNVLGTKHKNAADMQLCIDAMETLYTRPDIETIVLVAGDRDYIPLLQRFRKQAKQIKVVGFRQSVSGDLLQMLGEEHFIDAAGVLGDEKLDELNLRRKNRIQRNMEDRHASVPVPVESVLPSDVPDPYVVEFSTVMRLPNKTERRALGLVIEQISKFNNPELWAGPFFKRMADDMPELADYDRRQLITALVRAGAVKVEKRVGNPRDFSVMLVNKDHPDVKEVEAEVAAHEKQ